MSKFVTAFSPLNFIAAMSYASAASSSVPKIPYDHTLIITIFITHITNFVVELCSLWQVNTTNFGTIMILFFSFLNKILKEM